jgi:hypothetical protein
MRNTNIKIFLLCPIPEEQKPINQYIGLKENLLTSWTTLSTKKYQQKILFLYSITFLFISLFQLYSFQSFSYFFDWIVENLFLTTNFLLFLFLIILSRWIQIQNQFNQARFFYEETSWYDGQIWEKPFLLIKNDKLISSQKMTPIIKRIQQSIFQLLFLNCIFLILLQI